MLAGDQIRFQIHRAASCRSGEGRRTIEESSETRLRGGMGMLIWWVTTVQMYSFVTCAHVLPVRDVRALRGAEIHMRMLA
jgi:hypothetical protein